MREKIVNMYLTDTFLVPTAKLELGNTAEPKVGYLSKNIQSFFVTPAKVEDSRTARLAVLGQVVSGTLSLHFDSSLDIAKKAITSMTNAESTRFFNCVEQLYLSQNVNLVALDEDMSSSSNYNGYYQGSLFLSSVLINHSVKVRPNDSQNTVLHLPSYFMFDFKVKTEDYTFRIWIGNQAFYEDYPESAITDVIFPCDPRYFLDFSKYKSILTAVTDSSKFSFDKTHKAVSTEDHTGLFTYETRYNIGENSVNFMPFGIMYKGKRPSTLAIRDAIRKELEALGIADGDTWESLFPDLYVVAQFYIVPMWHNFEVRPERTLYPSVLKIKDIMQVMREIFPDLRVEYINEHNEILANGFNECFSVVIPDTLNASIFSFRDLHPTYVYHPAQHPGHVWMDPATQAFNIRFNRLMAVLWGQSTTNEFVPVDLDNRTWMTFVTSGIEYYVLAKEFYPFEAIIP
jgi:hypothetical protein